MNWISCFIRDFKTYIDIIIEACSEAEQERYSRDGFGGIQPQTNGITSVCRSRGVLLTIRCVNSQVSLSVLFLSLSLTPSYYSAKSVFVV